MYCTERCVLIGKLWNALVPADDCVLHVHAAFQPAGTSHRIIQFKILHTNDAGKVSDTNSTIRKG